MPDKTGRRTPKEKTWVRHYAMTGDAVYAAEKAGYRAAPMAASNNSRNELLVEDARKITIAQLTGPILKQAVKRHLALLEDDKVTGQTLNRAIEMAYKYGLPAGADGAQKQPHEMTAEELAQAIAVLRRAAADQAQPVLELKANEPSVFE